MDGIYNCSSNYMAVGCMCALLRVHLCFVCLSPPLSGIALGQAVFVVFQKYMQSFSGFSR